MNLLVKRCENYIVYDNKIAPHTKTYIKSMIYRRFKFSTYLVILTILSFITANKILAVVPQEGLIAYYPFTNASLDNAISSHLNDSNSTSPQDAQNNGATFGTDRFGNENSAALFNGKNNVYIEIPDNDAFSIKNTGALTISVWVCPKVLIFQNAETAGYVHWMGKGMPQQHEWAFRMYNKDLTDKQENRPNRISAYAFNLKGGLGSGSYVQEDVTIDTWIHIVVCYDIETNTITLFKNGIQKDQDPLYDETYGVQVENGNAPVRLGTRSLWSFFEGSIDDLRFYNRALSDTEIIALYNEPNTIKDSSAQTTKFNNSKQQFDKKKSRKKSSRDNNIQFTKDEKNFDSKGRNRKKPF